MNKISQGDGMVLAESLLARDLAQSLTAVEAQFTESDGIMPTKADMESLLALAVSERDQGRSAIALEAMDRLWILRKERNLCVEILVILVVWTPDVERFEKFVATIPAALINDKHVKLLVARGFERSGNIDAAVNALSQVSSDDVAMIPSFRELWRNALFSLSMKLTQNLQQLAESLDDQKVKEALAALTGRIYVSTLQKGLSCDEFESQLRTMAFTGEASARIPIQTMAAAMLSMIEYDEDEKLTVALRFLISWRDSDKADQVARKILASRFRLHPDFIKSTVKLSELPGMEAWRQKADELAMELYQAGINNEEWSLSRARIQFHEVVARADLIGGNSAQKRRTSSLPSTKSAESAKSRHMFVGFFGQLRFPNETVPRLCEYIDQQTHALKSIGWTFSYGFSTWSKVGARLLQKSDPAIFALERLPVFLADLLSKEGISRVDELMDILPVTMAYVIDMGASSQTVDSQYLESLTGRQIFCNVLDDAEFLMRDGSVIAQRCNNDINTLNQARMWNRIAAFKSLTQAAERSSVEVSHSLLIRADLLFRHGSLHDVITSALEREVNSISADDDPHANFIEGLGDRFMFGDRAVMSRLFEGSSLMQSAAGDTALNQIYLTRFSAHQFLDTILFENNTRVTRIPHANLGFEIFRGRMGIEDILPYISKDLANMKVGIKTKIEDALKIYKY